jgi:hypothetical protein
MVGLRVFHYCRAHFSQPFKSVRFAPGDFFVSFIIDYRHLITSPTLQSLASHQF